MKRKICIICGKPLKDGIIINRKGICKNCEKKIINCKIQTDFYEYYKNCIKKTIGRTILEGEELLCQDYHF